MIIHASQLAGLGDVDSTAAQVTGAGGSIAAGAITTAATSGAIAASTAAVAVPIIGAVVLGVTLWLTSISKKNAQKTAATHIVDDIEPRLQQNLEGYINGPRTPES